MESKLVKEAVHKIQVREKNRNDWVKQQLENSNYLNKLNSLYKHKVGDVDISPKKGSRDGSNEAQPHLDPTAGMNKVTMDRSDKLREQKAKAMLNARQNTKIIHEVTKKKYESVR